MQNPSYVYIMASAPYGVLYVGVTTDLVKRARQHREKLIDGFTKQYGTHLLVWYEVHYELMEAVKREKQLKKWNRAWKLDFVSQHNPTWRDLFSEISG